MPRILEPSFFCLALLIAVGVALRPMPGAASAVVLPPWIDPGTGLQAVADAGGRLLSVERDGRLIRASFDGEAFLGGLYAAGILVLRAEGRPCLGGERA